LKRLFLSSYGKVKRRKKEIIKGRGRKPQGFFFWAPQEKKRDPNSFSGKGEKDEYKR